tara:strand:- start:49894 stop:50601 length:708 start_codon:yes stop_codon:yes gene_type:complete
LRGNERKPAKSQQNWHRRQFRRDRAIVYIDGFNLYYGMRSKGWRRYYWLDLQKFAENLVPRGLNIRAVNYFTARIDGGVASDPPVEQARQAASRRRQFDYLTAVSTLPIVKVIEGRFLRKEQRCRSCSAKSLVPEEKKSDVNLATQLVVDAFHDRYDAAFVVTGDSDLADTIALVRQEFRNKSVVVAFPPNRKSRDLTEAATNNIDVFRRTLARSQLPDTVRVRKHSVRRPREWM